MTAVGRITPETALWVNPDKKRTADWLQGVAFKFGTNAGTMRSHLLRDVSALSEESLSGFIRSIARVYEDNNAWGGALRATLSAAAEES